MKYTINFLKQFDLTEPISKTLLVEKITKSKGIRREEKYGYSYKLHTDPHTLYLSENDEVTVEPGIYWVLNLCKRKDDICWDHYIFVVEDDGTTVPIGEFLAQHDTMWVKESLPIIKKAMLTGEYSPIELTRFPKNTEPKTRWDRLKK